MSNNLTFATCLMAALLGWFVIGGEPMIKEPRLTVSTVPVAVKGFPVVLRLTVYGPVHGAALTSFFDNVAEVVVLMRDKITSKEYTLSSYNRGSAIVLTTKEGEHRDAERQYRFMVKEGESRAALLELSSLQTRATSLKDIPIGEYELSVVFPHSRLKSDAVQLRLLSPSEDEQKALEGAFADPKQQVNWVSRLLNPKKEALDWGRLGDVASNQCAFYRLVVAALTGDLNRELVQEIKSSKVPEYLVPEREVLALEVSNAVSQTQDKTLAAALREKYPEISWRLDDIEQGHGSFLRFRREGGK